MIWFIISLVTHLSCGIGSLTATDYKIHSEDKFRLRTPASGSVNDVDRTPLIPAHTRVEVNDVLKWIGDDVFGEVRGTRGGCTWCLWGLEGFNGVARGILFFKLGYDLGERLFLGVDTIGRHVLSSLLGTGSFVPSAILGTKASAKIFKDIFYKKSINEKSIECQEDCLVRIGKHAVKIPIIAAGLISAPPMTYLTYDELHDVISWAWVVPAVPTYYTRTLIDYFAITTLSGMIYNEIKLPFDRRFAMNYPDSRRGLISRIRDCLTEARLFIVSLNHSQATDFLNRINEVTGAISDVDHHHDVASEKLRLLSHPETFIRSEEVNVRRDGWMKKILGYLGGLVGGYGMWVYYPVAVSSFKPILSLLGADQDSSSLLTGLAITSTATACALTTLATWSNTHKFYDSFQQLFSSKCNKSREAVADNKLKWKKLGCALFAAITAVCNAGTQVEVVLEFLDINQTSARIDLAAACIASFSTSFWAVDETLLDLLNESDPHTPILSKIDKIIKKLPQMSDENLRGLDSLLSVTRNLQNA